MSIIAMGLGAVVSSAALAEADYTYVRYRDSYVVQSDGSYVETLEVTMRPLTRTSVDSLGTVDLSYSQNMADLEILEAYVLKEGGKRVDVPADAIKLQDDAASDGSSMFTDEKRKVIVFPNVEPGDQISYRARIHQRIPYYPGHFLESWAFNREVRVEDAQVSVDVPADLTLYVDTRNFERTAERRKGDRAYYEWRYKNDQPTNVNTNYSVNYFDDASYLELSTMKDYTVLAAAYEARAADKAVPNDEIEKLADDLTKGIKDRREQARVLYEWVNLNIRYVATYIGAGGYVPHPATEVLKHRYGDCKDHVVLLEALLAAKNIESSTVLVNSGGTFRLPKHPTSRPFNHAITYLPEFDLFTDSTHTLMPFGVLDARLYGKSVVVTKLNKPLRTTPAEKSDDNGVLLQTDIVFKPSGEMEGKTHGTFRGSFSDWMRTTLADASDDQFAEWSTSWLNQTGLQGSSKMTADDPYKLAHAYEATATFTTESILDLEDSSAFQVPQSYLADYTFDSLANLTLEASPEVNVLCNAISVVDVVKITLPRQIEVLAVPRGTHERRGAVEYEASYSLKGRSLTVVRRFIDRSPNGYCTPREMEDQIAIAKLIKRDLRKLVLYRPSPDL